MKLTDSEIENARKTLAFLDEYRTLCRKHGVQIISEGESLQVSHINQPFDYELWFGDDIEIGVGRNEESYWKDSIIFQDDGQRVVRRIVRFSHARPRQEEVVPL